MSGSKTILSILILVFLVAGGYLILLSQGYVFDFEDIRLVKTGGIFLSFSPAQAELEINGQPKKISLSLFSGGAFINNLVPDEYRLRLTAADFRSWEKTVIVEPGLVSELNKVFLIPEKIKPERVIAGPTEDFWLTEAGVIYQQKDSLIFDGQPIRGETIILADPAYSLVVTETGGNAFLLDLNSREAGTNLTALFNSLKQRQLDLPGFVPIREIFFHPFSPAKFIIFTKAALYELDTRKIDLTLLTLFENEIVAEVAGRRSIFAADAEGNLITLNLIIKNLNVENRELEKARLLRLAADDENIVILDEKGKIEILDLEKNKRWSLETKNADSFTVLEEIGDYILFLDGGRLVASEIQDNPPTNAYELATGVKKYGVNREEIYLLKENGELGKIRLEF